MAVDLIDGCGKTGQAIGAGATTSANFDDRSYDLLENI